ncbi:MAG TPA: O-antigen ligase family protein [Rhizomicrobium sp.]|nr:O-antigen ligase family protein [Rhizomicrobium sp.]
MPISRYVVSLWKIAFPDVTFFLSFVVLGGSVVLGGGTHSGFLADVLLQLAALPLLWVATIQLASAHSVSRLKRPLLFIAALASLPLIQLIPLPALLWTRLPGHNVVANTYVLLGEALPWWPLTLSPASTWLSALAILPPAALFLATLSLSYRQRRKLSALVVVMGVVSAFLGLLQLAGGTHSALRFYAITNSTEAVGFFANRNHFAALLYVTMLFSICWTVEFATPLRAQSRRRLFDTHAIMGFAGFGIAFVVLLTGQLMARSRAGMLLAILAVLSSFPIIASDRRMRSVGFVSTKVFMGVAVATVVLSLPVALYRILDRFGVDSVTDARFTIVRNTTSAALAYMPFGSGLGTFVPVYQMFEKPGDIGAAYINHAHNDLLELWLEAGLPGLALAIIYFGWLVHRMRGIWRGAATAQLRTIDQGIIKAAAVVLFLLIVHSLVDYPLRTYAMAAIAAFCSAVLIAPVGILPEPRPGAMRSQGFRIERRASRRNRRDGTEKDRNRQTRPRELLGQSVDWPAAWCSPEVRASTEPQVTPESVGPESGS